MAADSILEDTAGISRSRSALRAPILLLAVAHAVGAAAALLYPGLAIWIAPLFLLLLWPRAWRQGHPRSLAVVGWVGFACALSLWRTHASAGSLPEHYLERPREWMEVEARVLGSPYRDLRLDGVASPWKVPIVLTAMHRLPEWQSIQGRCLAWWSADEECPPLAAGDTLRLPGVLRIEEGASIGLSRSRYRLDVDKNLTFQRLAPTRATLPARLVEAFRSASLHALQRGLEDRPEERSIILALLFGVRSDVAPTLNRLFAVTGTLHLFSISGLHVAMVATLLIFLLRRMGIRRDRWILWQFPVLLLFVLATGGRASALRALIMATLYWGAPLIRRRPDGASALGAALLFILSVSPQQVLDVGCQFSFLIVAGMIGLTSCFTRPVKRWLQADPFAPPGADTWRGRFARRIERLYSNSIAPSTAAWVAGTPLTAWYFNLFSPIGLVANFFVIPMGFLVVLCGAMSLLLSPVLGIALPWINQINAALVRVMLDGIEAFSRIPGGWQYVMTPPVLAVIIAYMLMAWLALVTRPTRTWLVTLLGCGLAYFAVGVQQIRFRGVDLLDADQGQAALIQSPGFSALVDTGPANKAIWTIRSLRQQGIDRLDLLILTHPASSHIGGYDLVFRELHPRELWIPAHLPARAPGMDAVLVAAAQYEIPVRRLAAGEQGDWPGELVWRVLHPPGSAPPARRAADASLLLHVSHGTHAILLGGGAGQSAEDAVLASGQNAACDVFVAGNEDRAGACSTEFLNVIRPSQVVLSGGNYLTVFNRGNEVRARVLERGIQLLDITLFGPVRYDFVSGRAHFLMKE